MSTLELHLNSGVPTAARVCGPAGCGRNHAGDGLVAAVTVVNLALVGSARKTLTRRGKLVDARVRVRERGRDSGLPCLIGVFGTLWSLL